MNIFVINAGSSSLKYQLIIMPDGKVICSGIIEKIGMEDGLITHKTFVDGNEAGEKKVLRIPDHSVGLRVVAGMLTEGKQPVISDFSEIAVVGHRVVHGGESFSDPVVIDEKVKEEIKKLFSLAPLHNPLNYTGIEVAEKIFTGAKQVAVFDTAFHQTIPEKAFRYAIPLKFYKENSIRAYGFHGTSHKYVSEQAISYLRKNDSKIITIHLGNGCSMTAIKNGISVETSMGFGPMNGLVMGTRCGDIDQSVIFHLVSQLGYKIEDVNDTLNKKSGMVGLAGFSDMRDIRAERDKGSKAAELAYAIYTYRIQKYIGAYTAVLNGLDAIVFTGGVGENDELVRKLATKNLDYLGIRLDEEKNNKNERQLFEINQPDAPVKILVIPTNEEIEIAKQCYQLLS